MLPILASAPQSSPRTAAKIAWNASNPDTLLKAASRERFSKKSGIKIRAFLADAKLFLTLCSHPYDRWEFFVLSWLESEKAEKIRRSHVAYTVASYEKFRKGLIALFGRFSFEGAYCATLRVLQQSESESGAAYAAQTTDLCSHAYAEFVSKVQLSVAVNHFIAGLADSSTHVEASVISVESVWRAVTGSPHSQ